MSGPIGNFRHWKNISSTKGILSRINLNLEIQPLFYFFTKIQTNKSILVLYAVFIFLKIKIVKISLKGVYFSLK